MWRIERFVHKRKVVPFFLPRKSVLGLVFGLKSILPDSELDSADDGLVASPDQHFARDDQ